MNRVPKATTDLSQFNKPNDPPISDISVDRLIGDGLLALHREIKNLLILGARGKLEPNDARDLRDHLKLLFELKDREKDLLGDMTDEELTVKAKEALSEKPE